MNDTTILILVAALMPLFWFGIMYLAAWLGGWRKLAAAYGTFQPPDGTRFHWQHASLRGLANYSACLTYVSNTDGFYVCPILPFRMGHRPLFVPWTDVTSANETGTWFKQVTFKFAQVPEISFAIPKQLAKRMLEAARTDHDIVAALSD